MEQLFTAVTISLFMMMGSALYVLLWDVIDNQKHKHPNHLINLEEEIYQQVIIFLANEDKDNITALVNKAILQYLKK